MKRFAALLVALLATGGNAAAAQQRLHGVVLGLTPQNGRAVVRHDAFGRMPSMTMTFRIVPRSALGALQPGNAIDADVDTRTEPWTLRNVSVATTQAVTSTTGIPHGTPLRIGDSIPDVPFVDQRGRPFRFSSLRGRDVVLAFIYTRCQDPRMCPLISAKFNALQRLSGTRALHLVEVTLDPSYDRPPVLARYGATFGANPARWTLAVGDALPTLAFAARFGIVAIPDSNVGIVHSEETVEIDPAGIIRATYDDATWQPERILADIDERRRGGGGLRAFLPALDRPGDVGLIGALVAAAAYAVLRWRRGIFPTRA